MEDNEGSSASGASVTGDGKGSAASSSAYTMPSNFDMAAASDLRDELLTVQSKTDKIFLDGSQVERIGTAGVQFLLACGLSAEKAGGSLVVKEPTEELRSAMADLGLSDQLRKWEGLHGA